MRATILSFSLLFMATSAEAQRLALSQSAAAAIPSHAGHPSPAALAVPQTPPSAPSMVVTGMLFGLGGIMAGGYVGADLACANARPDEWCELGGAILGGLIGELVMLPMGVHVASDRTSYRRKLFISTATFLAGAVLAPVTGGATLLLAPPAQLALLVRAERRAPPRR